MSSLRNGWTHIKNPIYCVRALLALLLAEMVKHL